MSNTKKSTDIYTFKVNGTIIDGDHLWQPHDRYDFIVPLHHFTVDIGHWVMDLEPQIEMALFTAPTTYSTSTGLPVEPRSEVLTDKGLLYFSTLYRPYIHQTVGRPSEGDSINYRDVRIDGHLEFDDGVLFARCDQIEFIPDPHS